MADCEIDKKDTVSTEIKFEFKFFFFGGGLLQHYIYRPLWSCREAVGVDGGWQSHKQQVV